jgi:hypothetical protein
MIQDLTRARCTRIALVDRSGLWRTEDEYGCIFFSIEPFGQAPTKDSTFVSSDDFRRMYAAAREDMTIREEREESIRRERR